MTKIAFSPPAVCAACHSAKPHAQHIDFEAAIDGPVLRPEGALLTIDDLIVCADCIREAAQLLAIDPQPMRELEIDRDHQRAQAAGWREYALSLEETYGRRPEPLRRGPGRPPRSSQRPEAKAA